MERTLRLLVLFIFVMFSIVTAQAAERKYIVPFNYDPSIYISYYPDVTASSCGDTYTVYPGHEGMDYIMPVGTPIYAAASGTVTHNVQTCTEWLCYGNYLYINHDNNNWTLYAHLDSYVASSGQFVNQGDLIAYSGTSGTSTPHLHWEVVTGTSAIGGNPHNPYYCDYEWFTTSPPTYADQIETCITETSSYDVRLVTVQDSTITSWYHTMPSTNQPSLHEYGTVGSSVTSGEVITWQVSDVNGDDFDDLIQITKSEDGADPHTYAWVYTATSDGGFMDLDSDNDGSNDSWKRTETKAKFAFVVDTNNDDLDDLILGYKLENLDDSVSDEDASSIVWKICESTGSNFDDCTEWPTDNQINGYNTFGDGSTDTFVAGDFDGDGDAELLRGRSNDSCTGDKLKWKRLSPTGSTSVIKDCWGYPNSQYLVGDVNADAADELVHVRTDADAVSNSEILVSVGRYTSDGTLTTSQFASDVGNTDGWYALGDMNYDTFEYPDLLRWSTSTLAWMENHSGYEFEDQSGAETLISSLNRASDDTLLVGDFGVHAETTEICTSVAGSTSSSVTDSDAATCLDILVYYPPIGGWWLADNTCTGATYHTNLFQGMYTQESTESWYLPVPMDFSGDGADDLVVYTQAGDWSAIEAANSTWPIASFTIITSYGGSTQDYYPYHGDFDGDGLDDALLYGTWGAYYVRLSDGTSFTWDDTDWMSGCACGAQTAPETQFRILVSDLNGDTLDDLSLYEQTTGVWYGALSTGVEFALSTWLTGLGTQAITEDWYHPVTGDINGDGLADIGVATSGGAWYMALSTGTSFQTQTTWRDSGHGNATSQFFLADMNGDTLADAVVFTPSSGIWTVAVSTGTSFNAPSSWITNFGTDTTGSYAVQGFLVRLVP